MTPITLPDDLSTEANVRDVLIVHEAGQQAENMLYNACSSLLRAARAQRDQHAGYASINKADPYNQALRDTMFARWGGHLDRIEISGEVIKLHCVYSDSGGDSAHCYDMPLAWLWRPYEEVFTALNARLDGLVAAYHETKRAALRTQEDNERATLAALLAKHGAPNTLRSQS